MPTVITVEDAMKLAVAISRLENVIVIPVIDVVILDVVINQPEEVATDGIDMGNLMLATRRRLW